MKEEKEDVASIKSKEKQCKNKNRNTNRMKLASASLRRLSSVCWLFCFLSLNKV